MALFDGKSREERAHEAGQRDGSKGEDRDWFYSTTWEDKKVAEAYNAGFENGRDNQPKEKGKD